MGRTRFDAVEKRAALKFAEDSGLVADSIDVRTKLMARVHSGEISLDEAQKELKKIKAGAKKAGKVTRAQAYSRG